MAIYITGDTHGDFQRFGSKYFPQQKEMIWEDYVVIAGDFGDLDRFGQFQMFALLNFYYWFHVQSILKAVVYNYEGDTAGLTCIDLIIAGDTILFQ